MRQPDAAIERQARENSEHLSRIGNFKSLIISIIKSQQKPMTTAVGKLPLAETYLMLNIVHSISKGSLRVPYAAKVAKVSFCRLRSLILSGQVPVAIDPAGAMWVEPSAIRNGLPNVSNNTVVQDD